MTSAYFAGRKSYHYGLATTRNPYRYYTTEYHDWRDGWDDEKYESDQEYDLDMDSILEWNLPPCG